MEGNFCRFHWPILAKVDQQRHDYKSTTIVVDYKSTNQPAKHRRMNILWRLANRRKKSKSVL